MYTHKCKYISYSYTRSLEGTYVYTFIHTYIHTFAAVKSIEEFKVGVFAQELGLFISSMSSPFCMRGEFDIVGTEISILHTAMHSVPVYLSLCGYCEHQIEMFYGLQRSLER